MVRQMKITFYKVDLNLNTINYKDVTYKLLKRRY